MLTERRDRVLLGVCAALYLAVATRVTGGLARTQFDNGAYADFYDIQAEALLRGDLALPANSIGLEAFIVDGREQMYFGLFPALLRLPVVAITDAFSGQLTVVSSMLAWLLFVVSAWMLTDRVMASATADPPVPMVRWITTSWKVAIALGTPMLMLAGPAWVFSEAIMWGVASCVLFQYRLVRELGDSSPRNQWWLGAALVLAVLNRPTLALGCLMVLLAVVAVRAWHRRRLRAFEWRLIAIAALSLVVLVTPNMIRFDRPLGPPMQQQVLSQVDEQRMEMLAFAGGDFVDPRYLPTNLVTYLRPDGMSITTNFPFLDAPHELPHVFADAVFDITYRTPSLPASTPLLFALAVVGLVVGVARRRSPMAMPLLAAAAVGVPAAGTLMIWGFIAPRYLADFVVLLLPLGLLGLRYVVDVIDHRGGAWARAAVVVVIALAGWSVAANTAMALSASYLTGPDGGVDQLVRLQGRDDYFAERGDAVRQASVVDFDFARDDPPPVGQIAVLGSCAGAWYSNGEPVDPWITLDYGPNDFRRVFAVSVDSSPPPATVRLALGTFENTAPENPEEPNRFELVLVVDETGAVSLDLADEFGVVTYPLEDVGLGDSFELSVTSDPVRRSMFFEVDAETVAFGHVFTRSLYGPAGQTVVFADDQRGSGVDVVVVDVPPRC